jgi:hypothetical protein
VTRRKGDRLFEAWREIEPPRDTETGRARFVAHAHERRRRRPRTLVRAMVAVAAVLAVVVAIAWTVRTPTPAPTATRADTDTCESCAAPRAPAPAPIEVASAPAASATPRAEPVRGPDTSARPVSPSPSSSSSSEQRAPATRPSWSTFEERGDYDGAYAAAAEEGLASLHRASSADELLRLAQVSRVSGHRASEREALLACRLRFPGTEASAIAAYELGRAASGEGAVSWFETYLREQPSGPLAREASGRLVEAHAGGGGADGHEAARRYLARWPDGPHAALAKRVLE